MNGRLQDRVAIVTGTARGIGRAIARAYAREGACVVGVDIQEELGEAAAAETAAAGGTMRFVRGDVASEDDVRTIVADVVREYGRVDVMVNNAVCQIEALPTDFRVEDFHRMVNVNFLGCALFCREVLPQMAKQHKGAIVNLSSVNAFALDPFVPIYGGTKAAIIAYTRSVAVGYGQYGVRANAICPGDVDTPLNQAYWNQQRDPAAFRTRLEREYPVRRIATPDEIADVALFLASDEARFVTGAAIVADGAISAQVYDLVDRPD